MIRPRPSREKAAPCAARRPGGTPGKAKPAPQTWASAPVMRHFRAAPPDAPEIPRAAAPRATPQTDAPQIRKPAGPRVTPP